MKIQQFDWEKGIGAGLFAGVLWGWIAQVTNGFTNAFHYDFSWIYNFIIFTVGGGIFGIVIGGAMVFLEEHLPFKRPLLNFVLLSTSLWLILSLGGFGLTIAYGQRYHHVPAQSMQGLLLSLLLGCLMSLFWDIADRVSVK